MSKGSGRKSTNRVSASEAVEPRWRGLYTASALAALVTVALTLVAIAAHIAWPPPDWSAGSAVDWFARFQESRLLGLLGLDLAIIISLPLSILVSIALYVALRRAGESAMAVATALALISAVLHLVSNTAFEMLSLSAGYAAATSDAERAIFLAAGEAAISSYTGTAFHVSYILGYLARIAIGAVMLRSTAFGKAPGYVSILAGILGLGIYLPAVGILLSLLSVVLIAVWSVMVACKLFGLARSAQYHALPAR